MQLCVWWQWGHMGIPGLRWVPSSWRVPVHVLATVTWLHWVCLAHDVITFPRLHTVHPRPSWRWTTSCLVYGGRLGRWFCPLLDAGGVRPTVFLGLFRVAVGRMILCFFRDQQPILLHLSFLITGIYNGPHTSKLYLLFLLCFLGMSIFVFSLILEGPLYVPVVLVVSTLIGNPLRFPLIFFFLAC